MQPASVGTTTPLDFANTLLGCNTPSTTFRCVLAPSQSRSGPLVPSVCLLLSPLPPPSLPHPLSLCLPLLHLTCPLCSPPLALPSPFPPPSSGGGHGLLLGVELRASCLSWRIDLIRLPPAVLPALSLLTLLSLSFFNPQILICNFNCKGQKILSEEHCDIRALTL